MHREVQVLTCEHHEGVLILRGRVTSWHQKQVAQEMIRHLPGVGVIVNSVEVVPRRPSAHRTDHDRDGTMYSDSEPERPLDRDTRQAGSHGGQP